MLLQRWLVVGCFALLVVLNVGCPRPAGGEKQAALENSTKARAKGVAEARESIAAGKLKLKEYPPLPSPPYHGKYIQLLREKCQVEYENVKVPQGVTEADFILEVRGWNETMESEIKRKFGEEIFDELLAEAQKK